VCADVQNKKQVLTSGSHLLRLLRAGLRARRSDAARNFCEPFPDEAAQGLNTNLNFKKQNTHLHCNTLVVLVAHTECLVRARAVCTATNAELHVFGLQLLTKQLALLCLRDAFVGRLKLKSNSQVKTLSADTKKKTPDSR
jgi:hypothetical protein